MRLVERVRLCAALVGGVLGKKLEISTRPRPGAIWDRGPCTDGHMIWLPLAWLERHDATSDDALIAVIAHEAGHGIEPRAQGHRPEEARADWIAGYVLGRLGIGPGPFNRLIARLPAGPSHPLAWVRNSVTRVGWQRGLAARSGGE